MATEILTRITVPATPEAVWAVLADFASYVTWNPFIQRIDGLCELGAPLRITLRKPSGKLYVFKAIATACEPQRRLQWRGTLAGMSWLFHGVHSFELRPVTAGATELVHKEAFGGLLSSPVLAGIRDDTERGFEAMNLALRSRVEAALTLKEVQHHG